MPDFIISSADFVKGFVPPDYVLDGILQRRFCYSMTAKTGVGKTAVAMRIAAHVAIGRRLGNLDVVKGTVLYMPFENPTDIQMRWLGLTQEMHIDPATTDMHFIGGVTRFSQVANAIIKEVDRKRLQPVLVVVDTVAACFEGDNDNDNVEMGDHARMLRSLTKLPGGPAVLVLAHPTKNAVEPEGLVPKGGGAFLNEVDGNIGLMKREAMLAAMVVGKFRGPEFTPLTFELKVVREHPILKDSRGRNIPTVICQPLDEAATAALDAASERDEDKLLRLIEKHSRASYRAMAAMLAWKHSSKVERVLKTLITHKLVKREGRALLLTTAGEKELNSKDTSVPISVPSHFPLPPLPPGPPR